MQGYRGYNFESQQRNPPIVVDLLPSQYSKPATPPESPNFKGMCQYVDFVLRNTVVRPIPEIGSDTNQMCVY